LHAQVVEVAMHEQRRVRDGLPAKSLFTPPIRNSIRARRLMTVNNSQTMKPRTKNINAQTLVMRLRLDKTNR
jgi:hypothetical protein